MNAIPLLTLKHPLLQDVDFSLVVYNYLVSNATVSGDSIISNFDIETVRDRFKDLEFDAGFYIQTLRKGGYIKIADTKEIILGTHSEGIKKLFVGKSASNCREEFKRLEELADEYIEANRSSVGKATAEETKERLLEMETQIERFSNYDFMLLFDRTLEVFFHERGREFMSKEHGQMKNFVRLYDPFTCVKVLVNFILHYDKWCKNPTIGNLVYFKDEVYAFVFRKKDRERMRKERDYETGF